MNKPNDHSPFCQFQGIAITKEVKNNNHNKNQQEEKCLICIQGQIHIVSVTETGLPHTDLCYITKMSILSPQTKAEYLIVQQVTHKDIHKIMTCHFVTLTTTPYGTVKTGIFIG